MSMIREVGTPKTWWTTNQTFRRRNAIADVEEIGVTGTRTATEQKLAVWAESDTYVDIGGLPCSTTSSNP